MSRLHSLCETNMNAVHTRSCPVFMCCLLGPPLVREDTEADGRCVPEPGMLQIGCGPYEEMPQGLEAPPS